MRLPLTARLLGLARVVVQSAGGSDSTLSLSFLDLPRAEALREHLLELAGRSDEVAMRPNAAPRALPDAGAGPAGAPATTGAAARPVLEVPNGLDPRHAAQESDEQGQRQMFPQTFTPTAHTQRRA